MTVWVGVGRGREVWGVGVSCGQYGVQLVVVPC